MAEPYAQRRLHGFMELPEKATDTAHPIFALTIGR